jgi:hypothetical protein
VTLSAAVRRLAEVTTTKEQPLASGGMDWTEDFAQSQIKGIGTLEALAALGLTLPSSPPPASRC